MFRKVFLAFSFILVASPALAQNTTCSDRPANDSSNACANTRFVQKHTIQPGNIALPDGQIIIGNNAGVGQAQTMSGDCTITDAGVITCSGGGASSSGIQYYTTRVVAAGSNIPVTVGTVYVSGYSSTYDFGGGFYTKLLSPPSPVKAWQFQSLDGAWWQLNTKPVYPRQVGAALDGVTDDTTAIQAWLDYGSTFGVMSAGQAGQAIIPTASINIPSNTVIDMLNKMTVTRTTDTVAGLFECNSNNNIELRNGTFTTTAGFSSNTSASMGLFAKNFVVPAGLIGLVPGNFVQITANNTTADHVNYEIARINSYSGTLLNVTATTSVGSGTYNNWLIDVYPINGNLMESNIAIYARSCINFHVENNTVSGRFYNAYDSRNGTDIYFIKNTAGGYVNRGIHSVAYDSGGAINNQIRGNRLNGNSFAQYGINTSASYAGVNTGLFVTDNRVAGTTYQGIIVAGNVSNSVIKGNSILMAFPTNGGAIITENTSDVTGNYTPQRNAFIGNTITSGSIGIYALNVYYSTFIGNTVNGAGTCMILSGTLPQQILYNTVVGNTLNSCTSHGLSITGSGASGAVGNSIIGNTTISNGGWGIISDVNTASNNYSGNVSIANTLGAYSLGGTGNMTTGGNL